ncbi:MAG TPA: hypothetical protein VG797_11565 [Phycisphaerales bacterium]|nr:hypothetical protein [Phycisphaerales bacterium]
MKCLSCQYDLRGIPEGLCPECGRPFTVASIRKELFSRAVAARLFAIGGLVIASGLAALSIHNGAPNEWSPFPIPGVLLVFLSGELWLWPLATGALYLIWTLPLWTSKPQPGWIPFFLFLAVAALDVAWLAANASKYGLKYQGIDHVIVVSVLNGVFIAAGIAAWVTARHVHSYWLKALFFAIVGWWIAWCAFPYLGELP